MIVCKEYFCANFERRFRVAVAVTALFLLLCGRVSAQETGYRDFGGRVDSVPVPVPDEQPDIMRWLPEEEFDEAVQSHLSHLSPAVTMSSAVIYPQLRTAPSRAKVFVMPDNTLNIRHINISNGSAGNWGSYPGSLLDARTLSFPAPGR